MELSKHKRLDKRHGSKTQPTSAAWGWNRNPMVRMGSDLYFLLYNNAPRKHRIEIYKMTPDLKYIRIGKHDAPRPGNIMAFDRGVMKVVLVQTKPGTTYPNDSTYIKMRLGTITAGDDSINFRTIVDESPNIRVGVASDGQEGAIMWGEPARENDLGNTMKAVYISKLGRVSKPDLIAKNLPTPTYYPRLVKTKSGIVAVGEEDIHRPNQENLRQKLWWFKTTDSFKRHGKFHDASINAIADQRPRTVYGCDVYNFHGTIHRTYAELTDENKNWHRWFHVSTNDRYDVLDDIADVNFNFMRIAFLGGRLYYVATSWDTFFVIDADRRRIVFQYKPNGMTGLVPFIASPMAGSQQSNRFIDVLLMATGKDSFPYSPIEYLQFIE